jgi:aspartokinase/homoserine dehydrogenase 1
MIVLKFGGSSVGDAQRILQVSNIVANTFKKEKGKIAVVVSAMQGTTDKLILAANLASKGSEEYLKILNELEVRHIETAQNLIEVKNQSRTLANVKFAFNELSEALKGIYLIKDLTSKSLDYIMSFGERISAFIVAETLKSKGIEAKDLDARKVVKTDSNFNNARVIYDITYKNIKDYFKNIKELQIITGFIGSNDNGETTTLGRGGSDYTASIFGAALDANSVEIWTDVDGVLTADPRKVKEAFTMDVLSYEEAMELSHFGAKVIYPPTILPAYSKKIPIVIKNTFNPDHPGSSILPHIKKYDYDIKGISSIDKVSIILLKGAGLMNSAQITSRIFNALSRAEANAILITQASSEHTLCVAIDPNSAVKAKMEIDSEFKYEINDKLIFPARIENDYSIVAVVGENMRHRAGLAGKVFNSLGRNKINIVAIAQGSSELNISMVIAQKDLNKALNVLHDKFFFPYRKKADIFLVGMGQVGGKLIELLKLQKEKFLQNNISINLKFVGRKNSFYCDDNLLDASDFESKKSDETFEVYRKEIEKLIEDSIADFKILVDCTADIEVAKNYKHFASLKTHIVAANKNFNSFSQKEYDALREICKKNNVDFRYETNVGAGLPIISTIKALVDVNDKILKIEAMLSGTMNYIFSNLNENNSFSSLIEEAKRIGYTEPNPAIDLCGEDVAKKLLILLRESGLKLELKNISRRSLLGKLKPETFNYEKLIKWARENDKYYKNLYLKAKLKNKILRYAAFFENGKPKVDLMTFDINHPFANVVGSENICIITTERYKDYPIVVKGQGAGVEITAANVLSDILKIISQK